MDLRSFFPERTTEEVLSGRVPVVLGGEEFILPVLPIRTNALWRDQFSDRMGSFFEGLDPLTDPTSIAMYFGTLGDQQILPVLRDYDTSGVLPDDEWVQTHATEPELLRAMFSVLAAAFPLAVSALAMMSSAPIPEPTPLVPTSSRRPRTAGRQGSSKAS